MERLPLEHIRVQDGPQPVTARPRTGGGALIYCYSDALPYLSGDGITTTYEESTPSSLTVPLTASATVFLQCQFNLQYTIAFPPEIATATVYCDIDPAPEPGVTLQSPTSRDARQSNFYGQELVSLSWTAVLTRDATFTVQPHAIIESLIGQFTEAGGSIYLAAIVGEDTGADCISWSSPG